MNRRIVLVDDVAQSPLSYVGRGLGDDIYSVDSLLALEPEARKNLLTISTGDAALLVGSRAFELLKSYYHFGIRNENYFDCSLLNRLGIEGGAFVKVIHESVVPDDNTLKFFMSPEFCEKRSFPSFKYRITKTYKESEPFLEYFLGLPEGTDIGFDYEGSGMPMDKDYSITGASLALAYSNLQCAVFFSFQDIIVNSTPEEFEKFKRRFAQILWKHQRHIWVYNLTYETQATWRVFGIECEFSDASVYNVLDGLHSKNYSLKWTVQRLLGGGDVYHLPGIVEGAGIEPWDVDFDKLESALGRMYYVDQYVKGKKKPVGKLLKCSEYDYQIQTEWKEVCRLYPDYVEDFKKLIESNFGNPFLNMPSEILGKYCCLDSFYTVLIHLENKNRYSDLCRETLLNNQRIYSRNSRSGLYINDRYRLEYTNYSEKMMLWGILYCATYRCYRAIQKHSKGAASLKKYPDIAQKLMSRNEFYNGDPGLITKNLLAQNVDLSDTYETGLDEGMLVMKYGQGFAKELLKITKESMTEVKFKGKIDSTIARKKKILGVISEKLIPILGLNKIKLNKKHEELEKLLKYQDAYNNLMGVWVQIPDIDNIPEEFVWGKRKMKTQELAQFIMENYYQCTSPLVNTELEKELIEEFRPETIFLATIMRDVNKLPGEKRYYSNLGINTPEDAFSHFGSQFNIFWKSYNSNTGVYIWPQGIPEEYPGEIWYLALEHAKNPMCDRMRDLWGNWQGWNVQLDYFGDDVKNNESRLWEPWDERDTTDLPRFTFIRKILINILLFKKYNKIYTTYLNGLFSAGSKYVIETPELIPIRDADPEEPGAVKKLFTKYDVMHKVSKRSSSGFHTIPSHIDVKKAVTCPVMNTPTGRTATLLSYFDISSAEVRTLAYRSGDPGLIHLFETGQDVYIYTAKSMLGEDKWNAFDKAEKKKWRKVFKVVYLAVAYRMSARTLGENLNVPEHEAQGYITSLFDQFPVLEKFIEENSNFPINNGGYVKTELGDTLRVPEYRFLYKDDPRRGRVLDGRVVAKLGSAGINYRIQSFSALSLASGFEHVIQEAMEENKLVRNIIVVHDSTENLFDINLIFEIKPFYDRSFMDYAKDKYGIWFAYDLEIGLSYGEMLGLKQISDDTIELTGSGSNIQQLLWKLDNESNLKYTMNVPRESIVPKMETNSVKRFIEEQQCCMEHDYSFYTIQLTKVHLM